jgi:hypothetical protein
VNFASDIGDQLVIDDGNASQFKFESGAEARDFEAEPLGSVPCAPLMKIDPIPRGDWDQLIKRGEESGSFLDRLCDFERIPFKNQQQTNFCPSNAMAMATMIARAAQGQKLENLSPASIACLVTGYRNKGHWPTQVCRIATELGWAPTSAWADNAIDNSLDNARSRELRKKYQVDEFWDLPRFSFDHLMTCVLLRIPVATVYMWMTHVVCAIAPKKLANGRYAILHRNSYGPSHNGNGCMLIDESKAKPDEAVAVRVVTAS